MPRRTLNIYAYDNYRLFLRDFVALKKERVRGYTQRTFAHEAGFGSHSYLPYLIAGERNLAAKSIGKVAAALGLTDRETEYFRLLVGFSQAKGAADKERLFGAMNQLRRNTRFYKLRKSQYAYLDRWYYPVVRELAVYGRWGGDYARLAELCDPPITPAEARKAVAALVEMDLVVERPDGTFVQRNAAVSADKWPAHLVRKARNAYIRMALRASDTLGPDRRNISTATVALSEETYRKVSKMLDEIHEEVLRAAAGECSVDRVYQLNLQLFPVSGPVREANAVAQVNVSSGESDE